MHLSPIRSRSWLAGLPRLVLAGVGLFSGDLPALAQENVDPAGSGAQYAWTENAGWLNAEPAGNGGPGAEVGDQALIGHVWGENIGWISLSCQNTASCAANGYQVVNDGQGNLSGLAWGENVGWIDFRPQVAGTPPAGTGVRIDPGTGRFSGLAWAENLGWVSFGPYTDPAVATAIVVTSWRAASPTGTPASTPSATRTPTAGTSTPTRTSQPGSGTATPSATPRNVPALESSGTATLVAWFLLSLLALERAVRSRASEGRSGGRAEAA